MSDHILFYFRFSGSVFGKTCYDQLEGGCFSASFIQNTLFAAEFVWLSHVFPRPRRWSHFENELNQADKLGKLWRLLWECQSSSQTSAAEVNSSEKLNEIEVQIDAFFAEHQRGHTSWLMAPWGSSLLIFS